MKAYIFTGQGSQFVGMGKELYESSDLAAEFFDTANKTLGYNLSEIMFEGDPAMLKQTKYAQPAIFLHSVVIAKSDRDFKPDLVAGHSLGEISALVSVRGLSFGDGLKLVQSRAEAMQAACEIEPSTMAAVLGLEEEDVEKVCAEITDDVVVPANYNSPGQLVISGTKSGIEKASAKLIEAGARKCIVLNVAGAFHSPVMQPAREAFDKALDQVSFRVPKCPIYQNVDGKPHNDPEQIKANLSAQLTSPVRWISTIRNMIEDGAFDFTEIGPKPVLSSMMKRIDSKAIVREK